MKRRVVNILIKLKNVPEEFTDEYVVKDLEENGFIMDELSFYSREKDREYPISFEVLLAKKPHAR